MLDRNATVLHIEVLSKLEISFNSCLVEVLSMFWVEILWFVRRKRLLAASKVTTLVSSGMPSDVSDLGM